LVLLFHMEKMETTHLFHMMRQFGRSTRVFGSSSQLSNCKSLETRVRESIESSGIKVKAQTSHFNALCYICRLYCNGGTNTGEGSAIKTPFPNSCFAHPVVRHVPLAKCNRCTVFPTVL
jgi:hypothetical protein